MPDITLLPILADIFDTTIDTLFGADEPIRKKLPTEEMPPRAFDTLLKVSASAMSFEKDVIQQYRDAINADDACASAIYTAEHGAFFANQNIGYIYRHTPKESLPLLENENAIRFLSLIIDSDVRAVLRYFAGTANPSTMGTICAKCALSKEKTDAAIQKLRSFGFLSSETITLEEGDITVWKKNIFDRMLHIYAILTLADFAENANHCYFGYHGHCAWR